MLLNIAYPVTGGQIKVEVEDENKLRTFYDKRMGQEVDGDFLGEDFKGYKFKISGGNDKQGFPMKQGVLTQNRVRLLLSEGHTCYRTRKPGERKRKSVRGCIVSADLSVLNLVVTTPGPKEIPKLTGKAAELPRRHAPKRASHIRRLFHLKKSDDVRNFVIKRKIAGKPGVKPYNKYPKIQRLITPERLQRKRHEFHLKKAWAAKSRAEADAYNALLTARYKEARDKRQVAIQKRRSASVRKVAAKAGAPAASAPAAAGSKKQ
jgi:small subunit ribosomal protein S6e